MVNSGARVIVPTDDVYRKIFPLIQGKFYTDFNALNVRDKTPSDPAAKSFWENLINLANSSLKGDAKFPFRLQGFYVEPSEDKRAQIIPAPNFRIIESDKIDLKTKFNNLDDSGMVNPEDNGRYTQYVNPNLSVSGVCLYWNGNMGSYYVSLAYSNDNGRAVFLTTEGGSQKKHRKIRKIKKRTDITLKMWRNALSIN